MKVKSRCGFTLIELLVVIAIIAILAAILFPVFMQTRRSARSSQCQSNLRQMAVAVQMYADDNSGRFPLISWPVAAYKTIKGKTPPTLDQRCWRDAVVRYVKNGPVQVCTERYKDHEFWTNITAIEAAQNRIGVFTISYSINMVLGGWIEGTSPRWPSRSISEVTSGSRTFMLAENGRTGYTQFLSAWDPDGLTGRPSAWTSLASGSDFLGYNQMAVELHAGGGNIAFVDGHVRHYKFQAWAKTCYAAYRVTQMSDNSFRGTPEYREAWQLGALYLWHPNKPPM